MLLIAVLYSAESHWSEITQCKSFVILFPGLQASIMTGNYSLAPNEQPRRAIFMRQPLDKMHKSNLFGEIENLSGNFSFIS